MKRKNKTNEQSPVSNMSKTIGLNQILKPVLFIVFAIILEIINFFVLKLQFLPTLFLFDFGAFIFLAGIIFVSNKTWLSNLFFFVFISIQLILNIVNGTILKATEDVFFFELLALTSEGFQSFNFSFLDLKSITFNVIALMFIITLVVMLDKYGKNKRFEIKKITKPILFLIVGFCAWIFGFAFYSSQILIINTQDEKSDALAFRKELWTDLEFKISGLETFGTYGFYIKDFYNTFIKKIDYDSQLADYVKWIKEGETEVNPNSLLYGKNLIVICMESLDNFAIDELNTPTLWEITHSSGISMQNFYSKNKTNISEDIGLLGYIPKTSVFKIQQNSLSVKYSLPNLFNSLGYKTSYFHSYTSTFYDRVNVNKNLGFSSTHFIEEANIANKVIAFNNWNSEVDFFNAYKDEMIPLDGKPFFSFYMTVSGHGSYAEENPNFKEYYERYDANFENYKVWLSENTSYTLPVESEYLHYFRNFKSAAMDTDAMVAEMISYLRSKDLMDETAILLYADHDCFYNELSTKVKGDTTEKYHLPFAIYTENENLEPQIIDDFTTVYSIYPTICELYGLPYNTNMCHGVSVFADDQSKNIMYSIEAKVGFFDQNCSSITLLDINLMNENVTESQIQNFYNNGKLLREKQKKFNFIYNSKWTQDVLNLF